MMICGEFLMTTLNQYYLHSTVNPRVRKVLNKKKVHSSVLGTEKWLF